MVSQEKTTGSFFSYWIDDKHTDGGCFLSGLSLSKHDT